MTEATLPGTHPDEILNIFGPRDQNLKVLRRMFDVAITHRDGRIRITGDSDRVKQATRVLEQLRGLARRRGLLSIEDIEAVAAGETVPPALPSRLPTEESNTSGQGRPPQPAGSVDVKQAGRKIKPRTKGQAAYVSAIRKYDLTFCIGPAGTGKTYLAVATAVEALKSQQVRKIVLVRPAVEAGESLGFLPGDLRAKLNPYLRPLLDALSDMIDYDQTRNLMELDVIEVIPLAYMRGRTLNDAFIILDEAQNTTVAQMKMFLTRLGERSHMVVSGDITQLDLPRGTTSGLSDALKRLSSIDSIGTVYLGKTDIVRHALVQKIVTAYEDNQNET
ncbi:PhoH-like protein [Roseimaritima multifibrata]|uniref:PhoH-like protein n=1 Tax=Roseimaritima multifibrata TaxID=1930274 RepID=A0A517MK46_9BACT|nr:PhoH family protein [Roseimaritima multifibrata]QDS95269.1 PhoH-like protein [Roseimaritima multifibrata]